MKSYNKMVIIIVTAIVFTIIANIYTLLMFSNSINELKDKYLQETNLQDKQLGVNENYETNEIENKVEETHTDNAIEKTKDKSEETKPNDKNTENKEKIIGTIRIHKINFLGKIYEGTSLDVLAKGVGHFENTPYLNGNVCLAAHNTSKFWAKLKTLKEGDLITYESFLGTKEYKVTDLSQIDETDWSKLENTEENMLTLITCVKGNKPKRLCVKAIQL